MMEQYSRHLTAIHCPDTAFSRERCVTQTGMRQQAACAGKMIIICNYGNSCALGQQLFCVGDILDGRARLVLQDQPFRICACAIM